MTVHPFLANAHSVNIICQAVVEAGTEIGSLRNNRLGFIGMSNTAVFTLTETELIY